MAEGGEDKTGLAQNLTWFDPCGPHIQWSIETIIVIALG